MNIRHTLLAALALTLVAMLPVPALSQAPDAGGPGAQIANRGANGVAACASCHGAKGEGNAGANFPRLAGQPHAYLARQLTSYANGSRRNAVMEPIAKGLSAQQIGEVAAYYAGLDAPTPKPAKPAQPVPAQAQKRAGQLAVAGDEKIAVQACANCHGPDGVGEPPVYPYLAGQHRGYLVATLTEWKSGARDTDPSKQMSMIGRRLSDDDIAALAAYYAAQQPPPPEPRRAGQPVAGTTARPAASPSSGTSTPATGSGVEQGAPTSGGGQGPGGGGSASGSGPSGSPTGQGR